MFRYMIIVVSDVNKDTTPEVTIVDCNIHNKQEADAEREWYIVTNEVDPVNVKVVEYKG